MDPKGTDGFDPWVLLYFCVKFDIIISISSQEGGEVWMSRYTIWTRC